MSDLQCPARLLLVDPDVPAESSAERLTAQRPAAVHHGSDVTSRRTAQRLCHVLGVTAVESEALDPSASISDLAGELEEIADQYRGEAVAVLVPAVLAVPVLRERGTAGLAGIGAIRADQVLSVSSDADGWRLDGPPAS